MDGRCPKFSVGFSLRTRGEFRVANSRFQFWPFCQVQNAKSDFFLIFLATLGLLAETNYIRFLYYQLAYQKKKMREIDFLLPPSFAQYL